MNNIIDINKKKEEKTNSYMFFIVSGVILYFNESEITNDDEDTYIIKKAYIVDTHIIPAASGNMVVPTAINMLTPLENISIKRGGISVYGTLPKNSQIMRSIVEAESGIKY